MKTIEIEGKKPIFSWCPDIEQEALDQMIVLAKLPFVEHCALMPDSHLGDLAPIGSVIATNGVILPFAVGTDCGCGLGAIKTNLNLNEFSDDKKKELHHAVERSIPVGFAHNTDNRRKEIEERYKSEIDALFTDFSPVSQLVTRKEISSQLGTLGGG